MKWKLQLLAGLILGSLALGMTARAQSNYATPYDFVTIAGTVGSYGGTDGSNGVALFYYPEGLAVGTNGNVYVVDNFENTVRKVTHIGTNWAVKTIVGTAGVNGANDGTDQSAQLNEPSSIAIDSSNNLYVADSGNNTLRKISPSGSDWVVTTIAGTAGNTGAGDGTNGVAQFNYPSGIAVDAAGNVYVADTFNNTIREAVRNGTNWVVTTIAGNYQAYGSVDGTNLNAKFYYPSSITVDSAGNLYVADSGNSTLRKITPVGTNWVVTTIAGVALSPGSTDGTNTVALFYAPAGITVDATGNLYVADTVNNTIRKVAPVGTNWVTTTLAGVADGSTGGSTDGLGASALFSSPYGIAVDVAGNVYVSDTVNCTLRQGFLPGIPPLNISYNVVSGVAVSWSGVGSHLLQTNSDMTTTNWGNYGGTIYSNGSTNSVTLTPLTGNLFFRLKN